MLHIKETASRLKQEMLLHAEARGDFIAYCCLLVSLVCSPFLLFQDLDLGRHIGAFLTALYITLTLGAIAFYAIHPAPRLLAWYTASSYSLFSLYSLVNSEAHGTGYFWSYLGPPLIIATLGIKLGTVYLVGFLSCIFSILYASDLLGAWTAHYPEHASLQLAITLFCLSIIAVIIEFATNYAFTSNQTLTARLRDQALKDELTGLANRRAMRQTLFREIARSQRTGRPISLLMVDIDYFKKVNDTFGHDVGDQALKWLADVFEETLRTTDLASRWGGEEFLILLPETDTQQAYFVANRIRESIEAQNLPNCPQKVHFTVSCGIANSHIPHKEPITDIDFLTNMADENLYKAKNNGRNRVEPTPSLSTQHS